jgi:hypothetical protein
MRRAIAGFLAVVVTLGPAATRGDARQGAPASSPAAARTAPAWIARSDANARVLLEAFAKFSPEGAGRVGLEGYDEQIADLGPNLFERTQKATAEAKALLEEKRKTETDASVREDLDILVESAGDSLTGAALNQKLLVSYIDLPLQVFQGLRGLLDDQVAPARREKALVRLRRYAGQEAGTTPIATLAEARTRERLAEPGLLGPYKGAVEKSLSNAASYVDGIPKLFDKYQIKGYEPAFAKLKEQLAGYEAFVRKAVLPRCRDDYRVPPEIYAFSLRQYGVDVPPDQLAERARVSFMEIRNEMRALAPLVAKARGFDSTDYRAVIRELKKSQIVGEAILPHYQARMRDLEEIIRREKVVTLPAREARIRLASEAESAALPAPNMRPPRLIGNTGEMGEFVLPLRVPTTGPDGKQTVAGFDDFTFEAASWTLTVHEGRPGHELQFASTVEKGVSAARGIFAANSVNVEGWALYAEAEMKPYEPLEGQLIALQHRLLRATRAFLDPDLQAGRITPEDATRFEMEEVVLSEPMAKQEIERYTFRSPGQATSYFYGYLRWMQMKAETEMALGKRFDRQRYHDFILAQGLLPPDLVSRAIREQFVPAEKARAN